jgi:PAS domain S-box-containing protein
MALSLIPGEMATSPKFPLPGDAGSPASPLPVRDPVNILIVDDEPRNLDVLESILYRPDYRLVRATSANDALLALVDGDFAVLVLDINMPVMNGIDLAHLIKQRKRTQRIPILFLTAYYQDEKFVLEGYGVGAVDYLTKPINPEVLRAKVAVFVDLYRMNLALTAGNAALEREILQRQTAEESLRRVNHELETRVLSRTNELTIVNAALKASESQLRLVADHASVYLVQLDRHHRFRFVNRSFAARFGLTPEKIAGTEMGAVIGAAPYAACRPRLEQALAGERIEFELELAGPDSGGPWLHLVFEPERATGGEVSGVVAVISDITARKRAEREMAAARDEAMAASRTKDDFLAALSHELRTPLSPVLLLASASAADETLPPAVREDFATIAKNALLEARLIDDLLDLTRISRGKMKLELKRVDVHAVLQDALSTVSGDLKEKDLTLAVTWGTPPPVALADSARLQQVFWNILKNAIKFTPEGGEVRVETKISNGAKQLTVSVTDSGIGMTPAELKRVFQPFSQGDHASGAGSHRFGGLGLGLAISRMLMQLHAGQVDAFSAGRGQGSTFVITLPLAPLAPPEELQGDHPGRANNGAGAPGRYPILLIEDHEPTRAVLVNLLNQRNYHAVPASTMAEALSLAATQRFEFVISDLGLPDGTGYDLMRELGRRYGLKGIALSGYGMEQDLAQSRDAGFISHLTKPVTFWAIEQAIAGYYAANGVTGTS